MEEIMGILIALFILLIVAFVIVICPLLCLVKICKMAAKINSLEKTNISQPRPVHYRELAPAVAIFALILLIIGATSEYSWQMRLP